jgi:hypothetical protein
MTGERALRLRDPGVEWRILEDETVVLDLDGSQYFAINHTGTLLWPLLAQGTTKTQLVETLTTTCAVEAHEAARDVDAFCARLDGAGLLQP